MPLPPITLLTGIDELTPQGDSTTVAELDDYIRQLKGFLKQYLAVAHDDRGELKELQRELSFEDITGNLNGDRIEPDTITSVHVASKVTSDSALLRQNIADDAIGTDEIEDKAVTAAKIADLTITGAQIANATITAAKISGVLPTASMPSLSEEEVEPQHLAVDAALSATEPGLFVVTDVATTNKLAKITGAISAALITGTPNELKFSFSPTFSEDTGILALLGEDGITTAGLIPGSSRIRNGWVVSNNASWLSIGNYTLSKDKITITRNGFYLIFVYTTIYGALVTPGTIEVQTKMFNLDIDEVLETTVVKTPTIVNTNIAQFGMGTVAIDVTQPDKCSFFLQTYLSAGDGTWVIGEIGKRASIVGIVGLA